MANIGGKMGSTPVIYQVFLVVLVLALAFFGLNQFVFSPMNEEIKKLDGQISSLQADVDRAHAFEQKKALNEQIYNSRLAELEREKKILPKEKETDELVRRLENMATESRDISITLFRPEKPVDHDFYFEWPIAISCEAGYNSIGNFFEQIANMDRIFNVYNLKIETMKQGTDSRPTIKAQFVASTFVYTGDATEKVE
jgi:type IV pilus assembly protein PilO